VSWHLLLLLLVVLHFFNDKDRLKLSNLFHILLPANKVTDIVEESAKDDVVSPAGLLGVVGSLLGMLQLSHLLA
jgi:hypothetical protein